MHACIIHIIHVCVPCRGESPTVQKGAVTVSAWSDNKVFIVMSTNNQPNETGNVLRLETSV